MCWMSTTPSELSTEQTPSYGTTLLRLLPRPSRVNVFSVPRVGGMAVCGRLFAICTLCNSIPFMQKMLQLGLAVDTKPCQPSLAGKRELVSSMFSSEGESAHRRLLSQFSAQYDPKNPTADRDALAFTQMVWKSSQRLGCAAVQCGDKIFGPSFPVRPYPLLDALYSISLLMV